MIRIIAGKHKNRVIPTKKKSNYRPSTGKFREAIFSILNSGDFSTNPVLPGARVLDVFAGTGSLAFEALSRGAGSATLIDNTCEHLLDAKNFASIIGEEDNLTVLCMDGCALPKALYPYDLVFMDPPYHLDLAQKALASLERNGWLKVGALIVIEISKMEDIKLAPSMELVKEKTYGNNKLIMLRYNP